ESAAAPRPGETSWQESLNVFAYAADPWSSYIYAGVAARAARILKNYSANLASLYEESAIRAANWAEAEVPTDSKYDLNEIRDERNLAALELYLLTEDNQWNDIFLSNTVFAGEACTPGQACADVFEFEGHDQQQAAFLYARAPENLTDATIRGNAAQAIERAAANSLAVQNGGTLTSNNLASQSVNGTGFKWTKNRPFTPLVSAQLATPQVDALLQAHTLTGHSEYLEGAVLGSQFGAGANPSNTVFTSGLSKIGLADREARNPFVIDARVTGQATPSGITSYGPIDSTFGFSGFQTDLFRGDTSPQPELWPTAEAFFDNYWNFQNSEFTIHESIAPTAYTWGYLAASDFDGSSGPVDQVITGTAGPDNLSGADGDDSIFGGAGNDTLQGGAGSDTLQAGAGNDNLDGGSGNDLIIIRNFKGIDSFDGGADNDTLRLRPTDDRNLRIFMAQGAIGDQRRGGQFFDNFERIVSGGGDDHLIGDASNNYLNGGYGNDTLVGGKGHDTLIGSNGVDTFQFGNELLDGVEDTDTVQNFKAQDALNFDDYLGAGGTIEFTRVATDLLTVNLSNEDVVNISGGQGALAVAENQLTALS
ncbi:MAG: calcium-binding protein, partial [Cyanobacteria bacterium P01_A01_bin.17]